MIDRQWAKQFAEEWIAAWNSHDLERILLHYTDDIEMSSPFIVQFTNEPSGTLKGKDAVTPYWRAGLARTPPLKFELADVLIGAGSITICYVNQAGVRAAEVLFFNEQGKAFRGSAHYSQD
ncbi:MAG: YybH family protein [Blastocatellia bacterium]